MAQFISLAQNKTNHGKILEITAESRARGSATDFPPYIVSCLRAAKNFLNARCFVLGKYPSIAIYIPLRKIW